MRLDSDKMTSLGGRSGPSIGQHVTRRNLAKGNFTAFVFDVTVRAFTAGWATVDDVNLVANLHEGEHK